MRRRPEIDFDNALNDQQLAAVTHGDGPQLVLAGAGSGKTRVITYRVAWLVREQEVDPAQITAVTFTNKAAAEMRERVESLLGIYPLPSFVGTFHRLALRLLRAYADRVGLRRGFAVLDTGDQQTLVKKAIKAEGLGESFKPQAVLAAISNAKNQLLGHREFARDADDFFRRRVAPVYRRYQQLLGEAGGIDFDDMIFLAVLLLRQNEDLCHRIRRRTRHLLVDEFQDTNHAQIELIHALAGDEPTAASTGRSLTAVGDEDQGIYRWRGADLNNILDFERHFPGAEVRKLERNYRSTQNILDASGALVSNNVGRRGKTLWTEAGDGDRLLLYRAQDEVDEARWVIRTLRSLEARHPLSQMAVLVRTHSQTRAFEEELLRCKVPYALLGGLRFYERAEVKDLVAYLRLLANPRDPLSFDRVVNRPPRGIGKTTHERLVEHAAKLGKPVWDVLADEDLDGIPARGAQALRRFHALVDGLRDEAADLPLPLLLNRILEATGYRDLYDENEPEGRGKLENIGELLSAAQSFVESHAYGSTEDDLLGAFLDHAALASGDDSHRDRSVALMTLHSAKGLEFEVVVVGGWEDNLLPHWNAQSLDEDLEEERRLAYVGMTRAARRLFLTTCSRRRIAGEYKDQAPSRFLGEIPARLLETEDSPELTARRERLRGSVHAFFGGRTPAFDEQVDETFDDETYIDAADDMADGTADATAGSEALRRGHRVRHATLGVGEVLRVDGSGHDRRITVYFRSVGRRKLVARYAQLEVL